MEYVSFVCEIVTKKWCVVVLHPRSRCYFNILSQNYSARVPQSSQKFPKILPKTLLGKLGNLGNYSRLPKSFGELGELGNSSYPLKFPGTFHPELKIDCHFFIFIVHQTINVGSIQFFTVFNFSMIVF